VIDIYQHYLMEACAYSSYKRLTEDFENSWRGWLQYKERWLPNTIPPIRQRGVYVEEEQVSGNNMWYLVLVSREV
jgi:hypothetical protein